MTEVRMTILESGWESMGVASGRGYQEVGVASAVGGIYGYGYHV